MARAAWLTLCHLIILPLVLGHSDAPDPDHRLRGSFYSLFEKRRIADAHATAAGTTRGYLSGLHDRAQAAASGAREVMSEVDLSPAAALLNEAKGQMDRAAVAAATRAKEVMADVDLSPVADLLTQAKGQVDIAATAAGAGMTKAQATAGAALHHLVAQVQELQRSGNYSAAGFDSVEDYQAALQTCGRRLAEGFTAGTLTVLAGGAVLQSAAAAVLPTIMSTMGVVAGTDPLPGALTDFSAGGVAAVAVPVVVKGVAGMMYCVYSEVEPSRVQELRSRICSHPLTAGLQWCHTPNGA